MNPLPVTCLCHGTSSNKQQQVLPLLLLFRWRRAIIFLPVTLSSSFLTMETSIALKFLTAGLPVDPLPGPKKRDPSLPHAPCLQVSLSQKEKDLAVRNALRYFRTDLHEHLKEEFTEELERYGHIYMFRFYPDFVEMKAYPIEAYPAKCKQGAAIMSMIMNNLDHRVAQYPQELVTYGGNGQVFSNWAQFWIVMNYLSQLDTDQTLSLMSGHPSGIFPSFPSSPRLIITNGMMVPNYSSKDEYNKLFALGVTMYGQMTAGSFCYIGPQGIVHGTVITLMNAGRRYLGVEKLTGKVFLTSGLGGMSGAQAKAAVICGCIGVIAEVNIAPLNKRHTQGWLDVIVSDLDQLLQLVLECKKENKAISIGYHGNIVDVWQMFVDFCDKSGTNLVDLASDQTSCHNVFNGGYYPYQVTFEESNRLMKEEPEQFKNLVRESLKKQVDLINKLTASGSKFWDYGNAFLLESHRAGADVGAEVDSGNRINFKYPSYVQHIMGSIFDMGFGPFRWVCMSQDPADLKETDAIALRVMKLILSNRPDLPSDVVSQYQDNINWIESCTVKHNLVVGSQARILYSDQLGRVLIATAFNQAVASGKVTGPIVISRDHHDVSGTDSPYRETSNIYDGSSLCADMAVQNFIGTAVRGATWVAIHNGGGVGWGEVINGGFGLLLDGTNETEEKAKSLLSFDVANGVTRRAWAGNDNAMSAIERTMKCDHKLLVTKANFSA